MSKTSKKTYNIELYVHGNIERSIKQLKKKIEREGVIRDMKRQVYFEPSTQKKRKRLMRAIKNNYLKSIESQLL
jgi:small subunit ribosomal protein S21